MRIASWCLAGVMLASSVGAEAQTSAPGTDGVIRPKAGGVVQPGSVVDPGMKVINPRVPPSSTPVIKPAPTTRGGRVVVPR